MPGGSGSCTFAALLLLRTPSPARIVDGNEVCRVGISEREVEELWPRRSADARRFESERSRWNWRADAIEAFIARRNIASSNSESLDLHGCPIGFQ